MLGTSTLPTWSAGTDAPNCHTPLIATSEQTKMALAAISLAIAATHCHHVCGIWVAAALANAFRGAAFFVATGTELALELLTSSGLAVIRHAV